MMLPSADPKLPVRRLTGRSGRVVLAAALTLLLHVLIAVPLLRFPGRYPRAAGDAALVFAGLIAPDPSGRLQPPPMPVIPPTRPEPTSLDEFIRHPPAVVADEPASTAVEAVPSRVQRIGAITSRIQAMWILPLASHGGDFRCQARLHLGVAGELLGVELQQCDSDEQLRASLLQAIRRAAPLPPVDDLQPGDPSLILNFSAYGEVSGGRRSSVEPGAASP